MQEDRGQRRVVFLAKCPTITSGWSLDTMATASTVKAQLIPLFSLRLTPPSGVCMRTEHQSVCVCMCVYVCVCVCVCVCRLRRRALPEDGGEAGQGLGARGHGLGRGRRRRGARGPGRHLAVPQIRSPDPSQNPFSQPRTTAAPATATTIAKPPSLLSRPPRPPPSRPNFPVTPPMRVHAQPRTM